MTDIEQHKVNIKVFRRMLRMKKFAKDRETIKRLIDLERWFLRIAK